MSITKAFKKTYAVFYIELGDADEDQAELDMTLADVKAELKIQLGDTYKIHLEDVVVATKRV